MHNLTMHGPSARFSKWIDATIATISPLNAKTNTQLFILRGLREGCTPEAITSIISGSLGMSPIFVAIQIESLQAFMKGGRR